MNPLQSCSGFWTIVESVRANDDDKAHSRRLQRKLKKLAPEEIIGFAEQFLRHRDRAYRARVLAAAELILGRPCGDDSFEYFRNWLISRGHEVFENAMRNADTLAAIVTKSKREQAQFEDYWYAIVSAYENQTHHDFYKALQKRQRVSPPVRSRSLAKPYSLQKTADTLPSLWKKFGKDLSRNRNILAAKLLDSNRSFALDGVGEISVGTVIDQKFFGRGVVKAIPMAGVPMALVRFADGEERPLLLTADTASIAHGTKFKQRVTRRSRR